MTNEQPDGFKYTYYLRYVNCNYACENVYIYILEKIRFVMKVKNTISK